MAHRFAASILVLSEDGGSRVVRALVKQILRWLSPGHDSRSIDLEPDDEGAQDAIHANLWKEKKTGLGHRLVVEIARTVATKIMSPTGYVFIHINADRRWKERRKNPSENIHRYADAIFLNVERLVDSLLAKEGRTQEKASILSRLCLLSPYYSIESWLFQNTAVAKSLCHKHHQGRDVEKFDEWEKDRGKLDDVFQPKSATCLRDHHNYKLADSAFPVQEAYEVGKSFAESTNRVKGCVALAATLAQSRT